MLCFKSASGSGAFRGEKSAVTQQHDIYFEGHPLCLDYTPQMLALNTEAQIHQSILMGKRHSGTYEKTNGKQKRTYKTYRESRHSD